MKYVIISFVSGIPLIFLSLVLACHDTLAHSYGFLAIDLATMVFASAGTILVAAEYDMEKLAREKTNSRY